MATTRKAKTAIRAIFLSFCLPILFCFLPILTVFDAVNPFSISTMSSRSASAVGYLLFLSFSRHFKIIWLISTGIWSSNLLGSGGCSVLCFNITLRGVSPWKGTLPVSISKRMTPREYKSDCWSTPTPSTCSGDMYSGVPMIIPVSVILLVRMDRAIPKSIILAFPSLSTMIF